MADLDLANINEDLGRNTSGISRRHLRAFEGENLFSKFDKLENCYNSKVLPLIMEKTIKLIKKSNNPLLKQLKKYDDDKTHLIENIIRFTTRFFDGLIFDGLEELYTYSLSQVFFNDVGGAHHLRMRARNPRHRNFLEEKYYYSLTNMCKTNKRVLSNSDIEKHLNNMITFIVYDVIHHTHPRMLGENSDQPSVLLGLFYRGIRQYPNEETRQRLRRIKIPNNLNDFITYLINEYTYKLRHDIIDVIARNQEVPAHFQMAF